MKKKYTFVANWKMYWDFEQTMQFLKNSGDNIITLGKKTGDDIVLCPSFPALFPVIQIFEQTPIKVGAQNCSDCHCGAFTGEVSAQHLQSIGCTHCIIGHSERRQRLHETAENVAKKCLELLGVGMQPIVCVGETQAQFEGGASYDVLYAQIMPVLQAIKSIHSSGQSLMVAYEPVFAIGTGIVPDNNHIESILIYIKKLCDDVIPEMTVIMLYGGSVSSKTIGQFLKNPAIDGFLIGGSSLDFIEFSAIVCSSSQMRTW